MTATMATTGGVETAEAKGLVTIDFESDIQAFLADPIGYGSYDHGDPISLDQFSTCFHHRGRFISTLT